MQPKYVLESELCRVETYETTIAVGMCVPLDFMGQQQTHMTVQYGT